MLHKSFFCQNIAIFILREKFMDFQISTFAFIHTSEIWAGVNVIWENVISFLGEPYFRWGSLLRGEGLLPNMEPSIFRLYLPQDMQPSPGPGKLAGCTGKLDGGVEPPLPTTHWELGIGNSRTAITW